MNDSGIISMAAMQDIIAQQRQAIMQANEHFIMFGKERAMLLAEIYAWRAYADAKPKSRSKFIDELEALKAKAMEARALNGNP